MMPVILRYEGAGEFKPARRFFAERCDKQFVIGEEYTLAVVEERSQKSHDHFFAVVADTWKNLPERFAREPWAQSAEHLRKFALIRAHFCDTQTFACGSRAEADRWARNLRPLDEYSVVTVEGTTVYRFTAQSQSKRAMGAKRFQESKEACLGFFAELLEVEPAHLQANAGRAA